MAAGRHHLSSKRYSHHSQEENHHYKNRYHLKSSGRIHDHSRTENSIHRKRNGFVHSTLNKEYGDSYYGGGRSGDALRNREKEVSVSGNGACVSSEKKRKFSPIMWDKSEKQPKISSKKGIVLPDLLIDVRIGPIGRWSVAADHLQDNIQISPVERPLSPKSDGVRVPNALADFGAAISPELHGNHDQELEKMEEGEYIEEWNISKSKWAYLDSPRTVTETNVSSPESGEVNREGYEESEVISSLAAEAGHFVGPASRDEQSDNELDIDGILGIVDDKIASVSTGELTCEDNDDYSEVSKSRSGMLPGCRSVFEYEKLNKISEGSYGIVYKARDKKTGDIVALKKAKMGKEREGFPVTALREINILMSLQHPSIVGVKEVVTDDLDGVFMVMEYMDHELKSFMEAMKQPFSQSEVKCLMIQLLEGLSYLHDNWVLHRDLKTSNLLLNKNGGLKICDFGMSRQYGNPLKPCTPLVVTLWYRAPEILLGSKQYSTAIDMWSVGCIMAELLAKKPLFNGKSELEQLDKIFRTIGTPNERIWPGYSSLPGVKVNFVKQPYNNLRKRFPAAAFTGSPVLTELGFDLLNKLLTYDPEKRITAEDALKHAWFSEFPLPAERVGTCK